MRLCRRGKLRDHRAGIKHSLVDPVQLPHMPNSEHCLPGYLCTGLYAVNTSGIMPTQVLSFVSESLPSLAQADDHRAKAALRAVRHLKC